MKIKVKELPYSEVVKKKREYQPPVMPSKLIRKLAIAISKMQLKKVHFKYDEVDMDKLSADEPCLVLMNHSSFIDLMIAETIFADRPLSIICTSDGLVGKEGLMRKVGCIPTNKFVTDVQLVKDMKYALTKLNSSILMYPEASYTFDGTATPLPKSIGKCIKMLKVPVIIIRTYGAFLRDPLYNNLQVRDTDVTAKVTYAISPAGIASMSADEIQKIIEEYFDFDNFKDQQQKGIIIDEPFRADYLNRVLYKCPHCMTEGKMIGKGIHLTCTNCQVQYTLTENGFLEISNDQSIKPAFTHIPDWYKWERQEVKKELENSSYMLDLDVEIYMLIDLNSLYKVGDGHLHHDNNGFTLTGCNNQLNYYQGPSASYSLYSDYYWYEIGDMVCIGDMNALYYCFPKNKEIDIAAKTRLATEELFKLNRINN